MSYIIVTQEQKKFSKKQILDEKAKTMNTILIIDHLV